MKPRDSIANTLPPSESTSATNNGRRVHIRRRSRSSLELSKEYVQTMMKEYGYAQEPRKSLPLRQSAGKKALDTCAQRVRSRSSVMAADIQTALNRFQGFLEKLSSLKPSSLKGNRRRSQNGQGIAKNADDSVAGQSNSAAESFVAVQSSTPMDSPVVSPISSRNNSKGMLLEVPMGSSLRSRSPGPRSPSGDTSSSYNITRTCSPPILQTNRNTRGSNSPAAVPFFLALQDPAETMKRTTNTEACNFHSPWCKDNQLNIIREYKLLRTIGHGNFSTVKLAQHLRTGKHYALKILSKRALFAHQILSYSISSEIQLLKELNNHQHIVNLIDVIETDTHVCLVLEHLSGGDLFEYLVKRRSPLTEPEAREIFRQILDGVSFLHENNICHRDLKLENVLLSADKGVKLVDFGLATKFQDDEKLTARCGSEEYTSPEVIMGKPYDGRAVDTWALGIILFALITGRLPFNPEPHRPTRMFHKICRAEYKFPEGIPISGAVRHLIKLILNPVAERRITIQEILCHPFMLQTDS